MCTLLLTWVTTVRTVRSPMDTLDPVTDLSTHGPIQDNITSSALGMYTCGLERRNDMFLEFIHTEEKHKRQEGVPPASYPVRGVSCPGEREGRPCPGPGQRYPCPWTRLGYHHFQESTWDQRPVGNPLPLPAGPGIGLWTGPVTGLGVRHPPQERTRDQRPGVPHSPPPLWTDTRNYITFPMLRMRAVEMFCEEVYFGLVRVLDKSFVFFQGNFAFAFSIFEWSLKILYPPYLFGKCCHWCLTSPHPKFSQHVNKTKQEIEKYFSVKKVMFL